MSAENQCEECSLKFKKDLGVRIFLNCPYYWNIDDPDCAPSYDGIGGNEAFGETVTQVEGHIAHQQKKAIKRSGIRNGSVSFRDAGELIQDSY